MNERDPFEVLRDAKPFPTDIATTDTTAKSALFEEITMSKHTARSERRARKAATNDSHWRRPTLGIAAATVAAVGFFSTTLNDTSAFAAVIEATEVVAEADGGRITVAIDLREDSTGDSTESGSFSIDLVYVGDDSHLTTGGRLDGGDQATESFTLELIRVGETSYLSTGDGTWSEFVGGDPVVGEFIPGLGAAGTDPSSMLELLQTAEDMSRVSNDDGTTTYVGTITAEAIEQLDPETLPAGVAMIAADAGNLPPEIGLTVTVHDGALRSVRLDAVGDYPGGDGNAAGYIDASITTTYRDMGQVESIDPPAADSIVALPPGDEAMMENARLVGEFMDQHPGLCDGGASVSEAETDEELSAVLDEMAACFDREAPPEVAAAWRELNEGLLGD